MNGVDWLLWGPRDTLDACDDAAWGSRAFVPAILLLELSYQVD